MRSKSVEVYSESGLEARPTAMLVQISGKFSSEIFFEREGRRVNGKSIMGMMTLGLDRGDKVTVIANGPDEEDAINAIEDYLLKS